MNTLIPEILLLCFLSQRQPKKAKATPELGSRNRLQEVKERDEEDDEEEGVDYGSDSVTLEYDSITA